ncbi:MAG TPA: tripartite tricarboxylate transporter substrate binding protein [Xanthobacteraceae bacterium]|nr:tripartite tricarboxylate transporter substrate binding protein [Xanthobacteraceae bacterium]
MSSHGQAGPPWREVVRATLKRGAVLIGTLIGVTLSGAAAGAESTYPSAPVHILVPYPPGGAVDIIARTLGDELSRQWSQAIVVENRPGAGGMIASQALVKAAPDGYTLILVASGHALNPYFYSKLPYGFDDFTPITLLASSPNILLVPANSPFRALADMLAAARAKPGELSYGHAGNGTSPHLAGELLKALAKVDIAAVPYKGGAPSLTDLIGGHIAMAFNNIPESIAQIRAGTVRALGVTTAARSAVLPEVPTIAEQGVPGYDTGVWWGVLAPAGLPADIRDRLARDFRAALNAPAAKARFLELGAAPIGSAPAEFGVFIRTEYERWGPIIKAAGIKPE